MPESFSFCKSSQYGCLLCLAKDKELQHLILNDGQKQTRKCYSKAVATSQIFDIKENG